MDVTIYTDGSSRGNPGPGGYGARLEYIKPDGELYVKEFSRGYRRTTNNRMELMAAIVALEALNVPCNVTLYSDSQYVINAFNSNWVAGWIKRDWKNAKGEKVKNRDLWERLIVAVNKHKVKFVWVKGHEGHAGNERCDKLATMAADGKDLSIDSIYELEGE